MKKYYLLVTLIANFYSLITLAQENYTHEEIVQEFVDLQNGGTQGRVPEKPRFMDQFIVPQLNQVIPREMQELLRKTPQSIPSFETVDKNKDLRYRDTPIIRQIGGRCSAYGLVAGIENLLGVPRVVKLSEGHLWASYRRYSSATAVDTVKRMAITENSMWPHNGASLPGWEDRAHTAITHITFIEDNIERAVRALNEGRPVYLAVSVTTSMAKCEAVLDPDAPETGGGHAVSISGYGIDPRVKGGGYFIIKNSWGPRCGDKGYLYMPFNHCLRGGNSYCAMWDIQGVDTKFSGVASVAPGPEEFDRKKIKVRISSGRSWWWFGRTVGIKIEGESVHARQIKDVSLAIDGQTPGRLVANDIDTVRLSFSTSAAGHDLLLRIRLNNGKVVESRHQWSSKDTNWIINKEN